MEKLNLELKKFGIQFVCTNCNFAPNTSKNKKNPSNIVIQKKPHKSKKKIKKNTKITQISGNIKSIFIDNEFPTNRLYRHHKFQIEEDIIRAKISRENEKIILRTPIKIRSSPNRKTTASKLNNQFISFNQIHQIDENYSTMDIDDIFKTKNSLVNDIFGNHSKNISPIYSKLKKSVFDDNDENLKSLSQNDLSFF